MFTGIIDHCGVIANIEQGNRSQVVWIESQFDDLTAGESIAVDGICLTVVTPEAKRFRCDISPETWQLTNAKQFVKGKLVNLERALRISDRLGGHFVTGHVDCTAYLTHKQYQQEFLEMRLQGIPTVNMRYLIKKGSVAVNGVSLTINETLVDGFAVMLIPHTLERTNLGQLTIQDQVNIEFDWVAKVIAQQVQHYQEKNDGK